MKTYLVDPENITNFNCDELELQLILLFWISAAGKNAKRSALCLERFLNHGADVFATKEPFEIVRRFGCELPSVLKSHGFGCYNNKARSMSEVAEKRLDLKNCSLEDLEKIKGIGPKTARCFLIHTRPNSRYAGLDTHALKYMRDQGIEAPKSTPAGRKYLELETKFLELADKSGKTLSEFDLDIWRSYSSKKVKKLKGIA